MSTKPKILIIDDDQNLAGDLEMFLSDQYQCILTHSYKAGKQAFQPATFSVVFLDIHLGGKKNGLDLLRDIRQQDVLTPVIMITRYADVKTVVTAIKAGANDYLNKPIRFPELKLRLEKVLEDTQLKRENILLKERLKKKQIPFFGKSAQIRQIKETIRRVAKLDTPVLITGETGVGKEIAAHSIHHQSTRKDKPFFVVNCNAIPENLIESELFGHEKGAFTGAHQQKIGKFEQANGSTLLIDEIGDLSLTVQAKLLHVLESQQFTRLGGNNVIHTDVRLIFATNKDLTKLVKEKRFREDLFYRINVVPIHIPPLRERPEDLELLMDYYLDIFSQIAGREKLTLSTDALNRLMTYPWYGNIRELKNVMERLTILCPHRQIEVSDLEFLTHSFTPIDNNLPFINPQLDYNQAKKIALQHFQRSYITAILKRTNGNITEAARQMGIPRPSLHRMLNELGMSN